jgi:TatD DNase family protein
MIDTHAHLDFKDFDEDREEVISRFFEKDPAQNSASIEAGRGKAIVNVGVDLETSRKSIELAEKYDGIFASVGIHPSFFSHLPENFSKVRPFPSNPAVGGIGIPQGQTLKNSSRLNLFGELENLAKNKKVVAVGECGLDYFYLREFKKPDFSRGNPVSVEKIKEIQRAGFIAQIDIAKELGLPVVVHCRNAGVTDSADMADRADEKSAWEDLYKIISKVRFFPSAPAGGGIGIPQSRTFFVLHCYSGEKKDTENFLKLSNVYFSFSGNITYPRPANKADMLADNVRRIPIDRMMLDSDSPYLAPQEFRGKRNEPAHVWHIARKIAEIKEISEEYVEEITDKNAEKFFRI